MRTCVVLVSTGVSDCLRAGIASRYVTKTTRSISPCIFRELLNRVPAWLAGVKAGMSPLQSGNS